MQPRSRPPDDISPHDFFTRWLPESVAADHARRARIADTEATLVFVLTGSEGAAPGSVAGGAVGPGGGTWSVWLSGGELRAAAGAAPEPDLEVRVDVETWRRLNRGELSAPEALVRRRVKLSGDLVLALKLHLILG